MHRLEPLLDQDDGDERKQGIMVLKATSTSLYAANAEQSKRASRQTNKKGSRVTEERAKAQRAKLDIQAEARQGQEEQAALQWHLFEGWGGEAHTEAQKVSATGRVLEAKKQPVLNSQESLNR
jgi:hypothetical protein